MIAIKKKSDGSGFMYPTTEVLAIKDRLPTKPSDTPLPAGGGVED